MRRGLGVRVGERVVVRRGGDRNESGRGRWNAYI